jgi:hypothetical protein
MSQTVPGDRQEAGVAGALAALATIFRWTRPKPPEAPGQACGSMVGHARGRVRKLDWHLVRARQRDLHPVGRPVRDEAVERANRSCRKKKLTSQRNVVHLH